MQQMLLGITIIPLPVAILRWSMGRSGIDWCGLVVSRNGTGGRGGFAN
jgi:hypothetical protein